MPEHADIKYNHSGKCPICGMTLIPAADDKSAVVAPSPTGTPGGTPTLKSDAPRSH
jgi:hypothetical protein